jgi:hypothetical protein
VVLGKFVIEKGHFFPRQVVHGDAKICRPPLSFRGVLRSLREGERKLYSLSLAHSEQAFLKAREYCLFPYLNESAFSL